MEAMVTEGLEEMSIEREKDKERRRKKKTEDIYFSGLYKC